MNRAIRKQHMRRCAFRKRGGGFLVGAPITPVPVDDWAYSPRVPEYTSFDDCAIPARPGQLVNEPNPAQAQVAMAGGSCGMLTRSTGGRRTRQRGGRCGCMGVGGRRTRRRGGSRGFSVDPSLSVGGDGPIAAALHAPVPCDARSGAAVQGGGAYSTGNAYDASCYSAPGSGLPRYEAPVAGFSFQSSLEAGAAMPDGVTAFNEVVAQAARVGGRRRRRVTRKRSMRKRSTRRRR